MTDDEFAAAAAGRLIGEAFRHERALRAEEAARDAAQRASRRAEISAAPIVNIAAYRSLVERRA